MITFLFQIQGKNIKKQDLKNRCLKIFKLCVCFLTNILMFFLVYIFDRDLNFNVTHTINNVNDTI